MAATHERHQTLRTVTRQPLDDVELEGVDVRMRDGVRLATDVYLPRDERGRRADTMPTLLLRTPYGKRYADHGWGHWFARRGYAVVIQDVRGTFGSEGEFALIVNEAEDGADTLEWIDAQPWSNGEVGTWGNSYASFTQLAAATQGPPNLRSIVANQSASEAWRSSIRHGGSFELRWLAWAFWHAAMNPASSADPVTRHAIGLASTAIRDILAQLPLRSEVSSLRLVPTYERWLNRMLCEAEETGFWTCPAMAPARYAHQMPASSVLLVGGWYDSYARSTVELYDSLSRQDHLEVRLLMGPWVHGQPSLESSLAGDVDLGPDARIGDLRELHLRWFEQTLGREDASAPADAAGNPPVEIFVMGGGGGGRTLSGNLQHGGRWRIEPTWPVAGLDYQNWYLHPGGGLKKDPPPAFGGATTFRFDPSDPVPTIGGNVSSHDEFPELPPGLHDQADAGGAGRLEHIVVPGGFDQVGHEGIFGCRPPYGPVAARADVLSFRSKVLEEDLEVTGSIEVILYVQTTAADTDFTAKLIDEYPPSRSYPNGYALNLTDSITRLRFRGGGLAEPVPPNETLEATIKLYPTSNVFVAGHRIRVDISSSNFPRFDVNPNTGENPNAARRRVIAENTVLHESDQPSRLVLPVVPTDRRLQLQR